MSGGYLGTGIGRKESNQVTDKVTRGVLGGITFGASEIPIGGKSVGKRAGQVAQKVNTRVHDFFKGLDPTNTSIKKADTGGIDAAQQGIMGAGSKAAALAAAIAGNPTRFQQVETPSIGQASTISAPGQVQARTVNAGQAQGMMVDPAQIAEIERVRAAQVARGDSDQVRARQMSLADALTAEASGQAPSLAEAQLQRQNEQAVRQQMAMALSARGMTPAMAQRQAAHNVATLQAEKSARAAELGIQERTAARAGLADILGNTRNLDVSQAQSQAQLDQAATLANAGAYNEAARAQATLEQQANLANQGEYGQTSRFNVGNQLQADTTNANLGLQADTTNVANTMAAEQFNAKATDEMARFSADAGLRAQVANQAADLQAQGMDQSQIAKMLGIEQESLKAVLDSETMKFRSEQERLTGQSAAQRQGAGGILGAAGSIISAISDKRQKKNIKRADKDLLAFADALSGHSYEYKNPGMKGAAPGRRFGIMAQDLEKTPAGRSVVMEEGGVKKINVEQALGLALGAMAAMRREQKRKRA